MEDADARTSFPICLRADRDRDGHDARIQHGLPDLALGGVALGFVVYMVCATFSITALVLAVPYAYDAIRFAAALFLLWYRSLIHSEGFSQGKSGRKNKLDMQFSPKIRIPVYSIFTYAILADP
nr:hypothetical protein [Marinicella sp. W31]MDC2877796.1 hypothetical protein [Marinicella sp. W31]